MVTAATRAKNLQAIRETVNWFSPGGDWRWMHVFADRESGLNHRAIAQHPADAAGARKAWQRNGPKFVEHGNPYVDQLHEGLGGWYNSYGLFQFMAPNHVMRWSWTASPWVLAHPVIATVIAGRLFNRAAQLGAEDLCDVHQLWATGSVKHTDDYAKRCEATKERLRKLGYSPNLATQPLARWGMQGFGSGPAAGQNDDYRDVSDMLGITSNVVDVPAEWGGSTDPSDPGDTTPGDDQPGGGAILGPLAALGAASGLVWLALRGHRRR